MLACVNMCQRPRPSIHVSNMSMHTLIHTHMYMYTVKTISCLVCIPTVCQELQRIGKLDIIVPLMSSSSQNIQLNAALTLGAVVSAVGERQRYLRNGAVERLAVMLVTTLRLLPHLVLVLAQTTSC
jgi:hypothetical protein